MDRPVIKPAKGPTLPAEILMRIVESVLPETPDAILPPWHLSTRTLVALSRVCRVTHQRATELLVQRCLYLDSSQRLFQFASRRMREGFNSPLLRNITSLYLAPFDANGEQLLIAQWIKDFLILIHTTLKRLIFSAYSSLEVWEVLQPAFMSLGQLEEFVCLSEYVYMGWYKWCTQLPLKRLVLSDLPLIEDHFWASAARMPCLQHIVVARPWCVGEADIKERYFRHLSGGDAQLQGPIRFMLLDAAFVWQDVKTAQWKRYDPQGKMTVSVYDVPTSFYGDEMPRELVQAWVRRGALDGSLWEWEGGAIQAPAEEGDD